MSLTSCGSHGASGDPDAVEDADGQGQDSLADFLDVESDDASGEDSVCEDTLYPCGGSCVDLSTDVGNCGDCGVDCASDHVTASCIGGVCVVEGCDDGWWDGDGDPYNGCEYECAGTADAESYGDGGTCDDGLDNDCDMRVDWDDVDCTGDGPEICNGLDDDCDTLIDEDFDLETDPLNCGVCGGVCGYWPHASPGCLLGECVPSCDAGWADVDHVTENGCEAEDV